MNSKILKLDAPYNVIYAGGKVGRHIATLMVWNDDEDDEALVKAGISMTERAEKLSIRQILDLKRSLDR